MILIKGVVSRKTETTLYSGMFLRRNIISGKTADRQKKYIDYLNFLCSNHPRYSVEWLSLK